MIVPGRSKLILLVRHGQAISNWLSDTLGPDQWFAVEGTCAYNDGNSTYQARAKRARAWTHKI